MDDAELRALLEAHHRESFGWALACCRRDVGDAEAVLQTVYLKVLQRKARFTARSSFKTWLFSVIRITAADQRRRRFFHRLRLVHLEEAGEQESHNVRLDETVYHSQIQGVFRRSLAALPKRQREVLQLVFYHDLSLAEAASVMAISVGSARTHYERAKKHLREEMADLISVEELTH